MEGEVAVSGMVGVGWLEAVAVGVGAVGAGPGWARLSGWVGV